MLRPQKNLATPGWKRINMRQVEHLIGVEFMHDLYNRHESRINSVRFRRTKTVWDGKIVNSYAPEEEWADLGYWLSERYLALDEILIRETENLIAEDRSFFNELISRLKDKDYQQLSNTEIFQALLDLHYGVLGELYNVNFVQIEHGLTVAANSILGKYKNIELSDLIVASEPTESQKEELEFHQLHKKWRAKYSNFLSGSHDIEFINELENHHKKHAHLYCAYGALPYTLSHFKEKYDSKVNKELDKLLSSIDEAHRISKAKLNDLNNKKLDILIPLITRGGTFRDHNKANLGRTMELKFALIDEIVNRGMENGNNIRFYLLSEIASLLRDGNRLHEGTLQNRISNGVTLYRNEYLETGQEQNIQEESTFTDSLTGTCASKGVVSGVCRVVLTKEDCHKLKDGEIMVAVGTDFDLMDAIHRSAAVITEEGGLLSHASVVCRELKKPCCIGVKNATSILTKTILHSTLQKGE